LQPEAKKVKKAYQVSPEWDKLIKKDTANKNLWDQVKEIEVFTRKEFLDKVSKLGWFLLEYIFSYRYYLLTVPGTALFFGCCLHIPVLLIRPPYFLNERFL
jgi:hypothetical protein